jgi:hypothetical protein
MSSLYSHSSPLVFTCTITFKGSLPKLTTARSRWLAICKHVHTMWNSRWQYKKGTYVGVTNIMWSVFFSFCTDIKIHTSTVWFGCIQSLNIMSVAGCLPFHYLHPQPCQDLERQLQNDRKGISTEQYMSVMVSCLVQQTLRTCGNSKWRFDTKYNIFVVVCQPNKYDNLCTWTV